MAPTTMAGTTPGFRALVEQALACVPSGRVTTYGDIARALGEVRASRAVAETLATNPRAPEVPCHRVVLQDGSLGGYSGGGPKVKARMLTSEGVPLLAGRVADLDAVAVRDFPVPPIFGQLRAAQENLAQFVTTSPCDPEPRTAIGVDAAYTTDEPARGFAAACAFDLDSGEALAEAVAGFEPPIPYVPGYLAFRELPGISAAVGKLPASARRGALLFVDGQGILHPRRCGIASMAGLALKLPSVGVAKGKLVGTVAARSTRVGPFLAREVSVANEVRGVELVAREAPRKGRRLYVSPGSGLSVKQAARIAAALTSPAEESPTPVLAADRLGRRARSGVLPSKA